MANRIEIPRASKDGYDWPSWRPFSNSAMVACANGHVAYVSLEEHEIADDGTIKPSLVCPFEAVRGGAECGWHPNPAVLVGWAER